MKTFTLFLLLVSLYLTSGCCFYTTRYVRYIGGRFEVINNPNQIILATNGAIALECDANYRHSTVWTSPQRSWSTEVSSRKKYLVSTPQALLYSLSQAQSIYSSHALRRQYNLPSNALCVTDIPYGSTNEIDWVLTPKTFVGRQARSNDLPAEFWHPQMVYGRDDLVTYTFNGTALQLKFLLRESEQPYRKKRCWWGYPLQVLVIPAVAVDIVTYPIQFLMAVNEFNESF